MTHKKIIFLLTILYLNVQGQIKSNNDTVSATLNNMDVSPVTAREKTQKKFTIRQSKDLSMLQGKWINTQDSLAPIAIMGQCWAYSVDIDMASIYDILEIILKDTVLTKTKVTSRVLVLRNAKNKFEFEIQELTKNNLSLITLETGKTILYKRRLGH